MVLVDTWRYWLVHGVTGSVEGGTGWYIVLLGQYNSVLLSIKLYWVSKVLVCLYILKKVKIWSDVTIAGRTDRQQTTKER